MKRHTIQAEMGWMNHPCISDIEDEHGDWVKYNDIVLMEEQFKATMIVLNSLLDSLCSILDCPYTLDPDTIPKAGIHSAPEQVVGTMDVSFDRMRKVRETLKAALDFKIL